MKPNPLRLVDSDEPTREQIEMARMEQNWREWSLAGWKPFNEPRDRPVLNPDDVLRESDKKVARYAVLHLPIPRWRRVLRWVTRLGR